MSRSDDIYPPGRKTPLRQTATESDEGWKVSRLEDLFADDETSISVDSQEAIEQANRRTKYFEEVAKFEDYGGSGFKLEDRDAAVEAPEAPPRNGKSDDQERSIVKLPAVPRRKRSPNRQNPSYLPSNIAQVSTLESESTPDSGESQTRDNLFFITASVSMMMALVGFLSLVMPTDVSVESTPAEPSEPTTNESSPPSNGPLLARAMTEASSVVTAAASLENVGRSLIEANRQLPARRLLTVAMAQRGISDELTNLFNRAIASDQSLGVGVANLPETFELDRIEDLGGGSLVAFKLLEEGKPAFSFKPAQGEWGHGWRGEVAAYRFCQMIVCHFKIPRNWPVRISKEAFRDLYVGSMSEERFEQLKWTTVRTGDGESKKYTYGALERWVPSFASWPIEYTDLWQPWLSVNSPKEALDLPLRLNLQSLRFRDSRAFYRRIVNQAPTEQKTRNIARQLSSLLVFDFVTMNWDRFSTKRKYFGTNNQFADGQFVSIDNSAAFSPFRSSRMDKRIKRVSRFSRQTLASLRALDLQTIDSKLLPEISHIQDRRNRRLSIFWEQRAKFFKRAERLINEHGVEEVLIFQ